MGPDTTRELPPASVPSADSEPSDARGPVQLQQGERVGRYVLGVPVGAGGMGVVYEATDPELNRTIAIKLVRPDRHDADGAARLLREAQAMAQLQHPNVVPVYDAGTAGERVFLAMERLRGHDLKTWLGERTRPWREALSVFVAAGRGLAAAHAQGIVHRDFKPGNVVVGDDGSVRVLDFGLAHAAAHTDSTASPRSDRVDAHASHSGTDRLGQPLTQAGHVMGTPRYMAPEQHQGLELDARADQFSFCVALYEAMFGVAPFSEDTTADLLRVKLQQRRRAPVRGREVPRGIRRAIERGLSAEVGDRFATMGALLAALDPGPPRLRALALGGGGVAAGIAFGAAALSEPDAAPDGCSVAVEPDAVFDAARREAAREAINATGNAFAADTWLRVEPALDGWVQRWVIAHADACATRSTAQPGEEGEALKRQGELQILCLAERRDAFLATVDVLSEAEGSAALRGVEMVTAVPSPEGCTTAPALVQLQSLPFDDGRRAQVAVARTRIARAAALEDAGRYDDAISAAREGLAIAATVDYPPLTVEAKQQLASAMVFSANNEGAEALLSEAVYEAEAIGHERIAIAAATQLVFLVGRLGDRYDEGIRWARVAQSHVARSADDGTREAALLNSWGALYEKKGEPEKGEPLHRRALALHVAIDGEQTMDASISRNNLGITLYGQGRYEEAIAEYQAVVAIRNVVLGRNHPDVGVAHNNLANALLEVRRMDEARVSHERSRAIWAAGLGEDHPYVAVSMQNLGNLEYQLANYDAAQAHYEGAIELRLRILGPDHPDLAITRLNLASVHAAREEFEAAEQQLRLARPALERALGERHPYVATCRANIAEVLRLEGRLEEALAEQREVVALREELLPPEHPDLGGAVLVLGTILLELQQTDAGLAAVERAVSILTVGDSDPLQLADARFQLGRATFDRDPIRALQLARDAAAAMGEHPEAAEGRAEADAWIAAHS